MELVECVCESPTTCVECNCPLLPGQGCFQKDEDNLVCDECALILVAAGTAEILEV